MFLLSRSARHAPSDVSRIRHAVASSTYFLFPFSLPSLHLFQHVLGLPTRGCLACHFKPGRFGTFCDLFGSLIFFISYFLKYTGRSRMRK
ncbi:hypothetical protein J3F84DRAFT_356130 [Trichoderma pleuroticola]